MSRVNSTGDGYKLLSIMGPDEWHRMDGEAYNTALASLCLKYAVETAAMVAPDQLHSSRVAHWGEVSKGLSVPITADGHHQTYDNYSGEAIMQPAVADLGYPLMWPMNATTRKQDLDFYWQKTSGFIVGMNWPLVSIGYNELNDTSNAALFTSWAYSTVNAPFMVVSEEPGGAGCPNFVTGAGGVLQMFLAGWGGVRLRDDSLELLYPQPPPGSTALALDGLSYLSWRIDVRIEQGKEHTASWANSRVTVTVREQGSAPDPPTALRLRCHNATALSDLHPGVPVVCTNPARVKIFAPAATLKTDDSTAREPLAATPPLGWNSWNAFHDTSAEILKRTASDMVFLGLRDAGYQFVNSDDAWMLPSANRSDGGRGPQTPDPARFPDGIEPVVEYIHALNLSVGIYTARANQTCTGNAGSCRMENVDAAQYAAWRIDVSSQRSFLCVFFCSLTKPLSQYVKDDSCGSCRGDDDASVLSDYRAMADAIKRAGRPMVLSIEGMPPVQNCSAGGFGNLRRVGVDIEPSWTSMTALVDAASGLWPFAHNGSASRQGFWNDLDLLEVGNGDFLAVNATYPAGALDAARAHFSIWCILKAPLLISTNLSAASAGILSILKNRHAIQINQDP